MRNQSGWIRFNTLCIFLFIGIVISPAMANYQSQEGRWMQQDPMQYVDGLNLYEYVRSNPLRSVDFNGLWESDIHAIFTAKRALFVTTMRPEYAASVGFNDNDVDFIHNPVTLDKAELGWHFDTEGDTELTPIWGPTDSRYLHAEEELSNAIAKCQTADDNLDIAIGQALVHLGNSLHPVQDWVSHGSWKPWATLWHPWPVHPDGTDVWGLDFKYSEEGILVDWDKLNGTPTPWPWDWLNTRKAWFKEGPKRKEYTAKQTDLYLTRFKNVVQNTPCFCKIYLW